ncbi:MAG TPA: leucine--tRNA ligase [Candidatus Thermoplasmatota archaeon]|nr:leucine--tRNA ligase [Candidatus Thermoplasmatota archaeon]
MPEWDLEAITAKWQERWWQAKAHHAERPRDAVVPWWASADRDGPSLAAGSAGTTAQGLPADERSGAVNDGLSLRSKPSFWIHFAYPGISGYLHVGHMRGFTYSDVLARYKRMMGHKVLFPAGFHASGIPAVAFAAEVRRGEKDEYLRSNGYTGDIAELADPRKVVDYFAHVYTHDYWKKFGFLIDDRRNCTTIEPGYSRFIQWQFRRLHDKGYLIQKPHYAPFCPVAGPVAVDKSETDIKQGGAAEVLEFVALKFQLPAGTVFDEPVILPCATLRPETVFGATNVWIHPNESYELVRVWEDGAVGAGDATEVWLVSKQGRTKLEWQFERAEALHKTVLGKDLVGETVLAPVTGKQVPVVAGNFVQPLIATGVVMSVPGHAPFDYAAYMDAGLDKTLGEPPQIVKVDGYDGLPARVAVRKHKITNQGDRGQLETATEELYADEFNKGVLTEACGPYAGKRIKAVKDQVKTDILTAHAARVIRQFSEPVVSRAGELVDIKRVPDQDFIHYADPEWTALAKDHAKAMTVLPQRYSDDLPNVLDWFGDRACVRRGAWLGTEFPFKPGWIIEPIADSTFYSWYYLVSLYVNDGRLTVTDLTDAFFDYIFNAKGATADGGPPAEAGDDAELWRDIRRDVLYWGPVDVNLGGKEHQTVHFPVYIMNNVALMREPKLWPRGIFVNWWVTQKAGAKISKSKGGAEPIPGAAKKYGVDAMRLYYCHVGSPHVDIEWDPDIVFDYRRHVERIIRATEDALTATGQPAPIDGWLKAAFGQVLANATKAYEAYDLRTAATELVYTVPELLRWYERRGGADGQMLRVLVRDWSKALLPILPHVAEEMHERAGGKGLATDAHFPVPAPADPLALAVEEYLKAVLDDIQTVRKLANIEQPASLALFTTPNWKRELSAKAVRMAAASGGKFPMGQFMQESMADPHLRTLGKFVQAFTSKLPSQVTQFTPAQKTLLLSDADEAQILQGAAEFLAREVGVAAVQVYRADQPSAPEHPKKGVAAPLKPGIALA